MEEETKDNHKRRIEELVSYWAGLLGLHNWELNIRYEDVKSENIDAPEDGVGYCDADPKYMSAAIVFDLNRLEVVSDEVVVHELLHCIQSEVDGFVSRHISKNDGDQYDYYNEKQVAIIARVIVRANRGNEASE